VIWAVPIALAAGKKWKMLRGFLAVAGFLALFSAALVGARGLMDWIHLLQEPSTDAVPHLMMNLRALMLQWGTPAGILAAAAAAVSFAAVLKRGSFADQCSAALLAGLLFSPHTYIQDYSLVVLPALTTPYRLARYMFLLPWPFFWPGNHLLPFTLLALLHLILLAVHPLLPRIVRPRSPMQANGGGSVAVQTTDNEADALETSGHLHRGRTRTPADCTREGAVS
jgi:hypothetical protein